MKAVILAAGEGTRLEPLTNVRPKPMLPVGTKPILEHVVEAVSDAGIDDIILVVGYKRGRIQDHFGDGHAWDVDISYVVQETQLGSGHALLQAESEVSSDIVVLNGDQLINSAAIEAVIEERQQTGDTVLAVTRSAETGLYGVVEVEDGMVVEIQEKPPEPMTRSDLVNAGIYAFGPDIFAAIRDTDTEGELGLTATLHQHLKDHPIRVTRYEGPWFDVTWPWDMLTVNGYLLDRRNGFPSTNVSIHETATVAEDNAYDDNVSIQPNASILRGTALGENVSIGANTVVENTVIMPDATIGPGTVLRDCIIGANVKIGPGTTVEGGDATLVINDTVHRNVRFGGVAGDNATLGGDITMAPGTRLGNDSEVESGSHLDGWFDPHSTIQRG